MESQIIDLKNESNRLATFTGWPISFIISPKSLASAGFYYTKQIDKVISGFYNAYVLLKLINILNSVKVFPF